MKADRTRVPRALQVSSARTAAAGALTVAAVLCAAVSLAAPARGQSSGAASQCGPGHWVAGWTADPSGTLGAGFANQTLRIVLAPHIGGDQLRVHLSNRFGSGPVTFTRAAVGLRESGAALVTGSDRQLSFAGRPEVSVPAGGEALSDPVALSFGAFQDLAVSLFLALPTGPATGHQIGLEHSYATAPVSGDHSSESAAGAFVTSTTNVDYVDAVDVLAPANVGAAVVLGDSITDGYESTGPSGAQEQGGIDQNHRFPDYLARRLLAQSGGPLLSVLNAGISGNRLLSDGLSELAGPSAQARLDSDVLAVAGVTDVIVLEGINDIDNVAGVGQVTAALGQIVARLHARRLHVLLGTITPAGSGLLNLGGVVPGAYVDSPANQVRLAVNDWIRSGASGADSVIDFDAALRSAAQPNVLDPAVDSGDHVHPNYVGYSRMAGVVSLASLGGSFCEASARTATTLHLHARARPAGRLRVTGIIASAAAADCTGARVTVRGLRTGHTVLRRRLRVTASCRFAMTRTIAGHGRIEVRASFAGTRTLLPARANPVFVSTG